MHYLKNAFVTKTRRVWPKSAPYLRLKNSKMTSKCQSTLLQHPNFFENSHNAKKIEGDPLGNFLNEKSLAMPEKTKGDPLVSSGIVCYAGNLLGSVPWANRGNLKFCRTFGRTILVTSDVSKNFLKNRRKAVTIVDIFL